MRAGAVSVAAPALWFFGDLSGFEGPRGSSLASGRGDDPGRSVGGDDLSVGKQLSGVVEEQYPVAQQAPALLRVVCHGMGRLTVR